MCALLDSKDDNFMREFSAEKEENFINAFVMDSTTFLCIIENFLVFMFLLEREMFFD